MSALLPFTVLAPDERPGARLALAPELDALYGPLAFPAHPGRPYVIANFVTTLDGVVTLGAPRHSGGGDISGKNQHDRLLMGILRAVADIVVVAAGTLRAEPFHIWTAETIAPQFGAAYAQTRDLLGKSQPPLTVMVTSSGNLDLRLPVFQSGKTDVCIAAPEAVAKTIQERNPPSHVRVVGLAGEKTVSIRAVLLAAQQLRQSDVILCEGGPHLMGDFLAERCLDELFLTLAPQVAGRDDPAQRPGFASGHTFAPERPLWSALADVRRVGSHLFLRYGFGA